jgi:asparagine synthase (glutamine-hydrolysing)|tara:strand:+ start:3 stop:1844 length:1842 start_codon:yes stop_codon:yes gene_type:complete
MCGIAGIYNFDQSKIDPEITNSIKDSLEHRGPDFSKIEYIDNKVVLIHTRLAIIDLDQRSNQPMVSKDKRYSIVFNGEIYNFKEIRKTLEAKGVNFYTDGDTEVLLEGYIHFGSDVLQLLRGQFSFAIYDSKEKSFFLARDRVGIKPLYFALNNNKFIFSSELKAIEKSNLFPFSADFDSYVAYLRHLAVPTYRTGNKNISKLEPGQFLYLDKNKNISKYKYWDPFCIEEDESITEQEAISKVEELLIESVNYRKVSDVEVGLFLSGGLDSSLIGKLMSKNTNSNVKGFNIDYEEHFEGYQGEVEEARFAAKNIGVNLVEDKIQYSDFKKIIDNYSFYQDDLVGDEVGIPLYFLGKSSKKNGIKVVQVGEGADELFYGYDHWLRFMKLNRYIKPITKSSSINIQFKNHRTNMLSNILLNRNSFAGGALGFNLPEIDDLLVNGITNDFELINYVDNKWDDYFSNKNSKLSKWMTLIDLQIRLPELLLMRMDKLVMQSSIEARVPFLDHKLIEYILTIPEKIIFDKKTTKPLLKHVANKHIPQKIYSRTKQGFRAPVGEWIKKDQEYFYDSIRSFNSSTNLFKSKSLEKIISGRDYQKKWYLSNLAKWHLSRSIG